MNVGRYLRGEDRHVGAVTVRKPKMRPILPCPHIRREPGSPWWKCSSRKPQLYGPPRSGTNYCSDTPMGAYLFWLSKRTMAVRDRILTYYPRLVPLLKEQYPLVWVPQHLGEPR